MKHISQIDATAGFPAHVRERLVSEIQNEEQAWTRSDIDLLIQAVAGYWNLMPAQIKSDSRRRIVFEARMTAICITRVKSRLSMDEIGKIFNRDHTSVVHSIRAIHEHCKKDASFNDIITKHWPEALLAVNSIDAEKWNNSRRTENTRRLLAIKDRAQEGA